MQLFSHIIPNPFRSVLFAVFLGALMSALPASAYSEDQTEKDISQNISNTMNGLIELLKQNEAQYTANTDLFYHDLNHELSKVINFKRIALKVMGKHGRKASKAERAAFTDVFKRSLYKAYAGALLNDTNVSSRVISANINPRNPKKAKVNLEVVNGSGTKFELVYSLHQGKDKVYRVENIVVMGINLGLVFRDQFQQQMKRHKGNISQVIESWSVNESV